MQTLSLWPAFIQGVMLERAANGFGTLIFDLSAAGHREAVQILQPCFILVPEAASAHDLIVQWMLTFKPADIPPARLPLH